MTSPFPSRCDVLVVGARPAGAATSMLLARAGARVLAIDRGHYGTDTLSTHALMRGAVHLLARWGALDRIRASGTPAVRTTIFRYGLEDVAVAIKPRGGVDALHAPRRSVLDRVLVDLAREAGADVRHGVRLGRLHREGHRVTGATLVDGQGDEHQVAAGLVVGADGLGSLVARQVGAESYRQGRHATATVYGHFPGTWTPEYRWYFSPGVSAGAIPTNDGRACVFATVPAGRFAEVFRPDLAAGFRATLERAAPDVVPQVTAASDAVRLHGFGGHAGFLRESVGPGWMLVGDAAHFKDPITAHGITDALRDADLLARAVIDGSETALAGYQEARDELALPIFDVTDAIASFAWDLPAVQRLHRHLSEAMAHEVRALEAQAPGSPVTPAYSASSAPTPRPLAAAGAPPQGG
ncbi:MAG: NAD(P)/FAD-dependent oxidoreductase [Vicinamibacterales bacterium]